MKKAHISFSLIVLLCNSLNAMQEPSHTVEPLNTQAPWNSDEQKSLQELYSAALKQHAFDRAHALQKAGADPDAQNDAGNTELHTAVLEADEVRVKFLLQVSQNPNKQNSSGRTAALLATMKKYDHDETKRNGRLFKAFLQDKKIDWNLKDLKEKSPLVLALKNNDSVAFPELLERGATLTAQEQETYQETIENIYAAQEVLINASPLYRAQKAAENVLEELESTVVSAIDTHGATLKQKWYALVAYATGEEPELESSSVE